MSQEATLRQRIIELLRSSAEPLTVDEIVLALDLEPWRAKEVYEHLTHIAKTVRSRSGGGEVLVMTPPYCRSCGYTFKELRKPKKPSRCPRCKSERISPPAFKILLSRDL
ncbi:MAG: transcriptional regulator [Thermoprotei archaeon]|nr:MAG: transcriptional regulator [Thermoprotei archaeon]